MKKILVGSKAFFGNIAGFKSKDSDYIELVEDPQGFKWRKEISLRGIDTFQYKLESPQEMVRRTLENNEPLLVGKFLVKEFSEAIGATTQDIAPLEPLLEKLDKKHAYLKPIFAAIIEGQSFDIPAPVREEAYRLYKEARTSTPVDVVQAL